MHTPALEIPPEKDQFTVVPKLIRTNGGRPLDLNRVIAEAKRQLGWPRQPPEIVELPEPTEADRARVRQEAEWHEQNVRCYERNVEHLRANYIGQFVCIANGEIFAGEDGARVYAEASSKYPDQRGSFFTIRLLNG